MSWVFLSLVRFPSLNVWRSARLNGTRMKMRNGWSKMNDKSDITTCKRFRPVTCSLSGKTTPSREWMPKASELIRFNYDAIMICRYIRFAQREGRRSRKINHKVFFWLENPRRRDTKHALKWFSLGTPIDFKTAHNAFDTKCLGWIRFWATTLRRWGAQKTRMKWKRLKKRLFNNISRWLVDFLIDTTYSMAWRAH